MKYLLPALLWAALGGQIGAAPADAQRQQARLARGRYLVEGPAQCFDCHSDLRTRTRPIQIVPGRKGAGRINPLNPVTGVQVVTPNITPDRETGIGAWSDAEIGRAIRQGIGRDGKTLFRRMPYEFFNRMSDDDLASVIAYLRSIPPVRNRLPRSTVPAAVAATLRPAPDPGHVPEPDRGTPQRRGAYLVNLAHCAGCHSTGRDGQRTPGLEFGGGVVFTRNLVLQDHEGETHASANITPDPSGISYYDSSLFIKTMRTGAVNGVRPLDTTMPWSFFRKMTDSDLADIFAFLQTLRPVSHRVDNRESPTLCPLDGLRHGLGDHNVRAGAVATRQ
jgi:mono/diheme cytochrome c family protein